MKLLLLLVLILLVNPQFFFGQQTSGAIKQRAVPETANSKIEQEIRSILKERDKAFVQYGTVSKPLVEWMEKYTDQQYEAIMDNRRQTRSFLIYDYNSDRPPGFTAKVTTLFESEGFTFFDNVVIATYKHTLDVQPEKAPPQKYVNFVTSVFMKRNGKWRIIGEHLSSIKE